MEWAADEFASGAGAVPLVCIVLKPTSGVAE